MSHILGTTAERVIPASLLLYRGGSSRPTFVLFIKGDASESGNSSVGVLLSKFFSGGASEAHLIHQNHL